MAVADANIDTDFTIRGRSIGRFAESQNAVSCG